MEIELPSSGCNIYYGTYLDNYLNNTRTRYYINEGKLIKNNVTTSSYNTTPSGAYCLTSADKLLYRPQDTIYFPIISLAICSFVFVILYKIIVKRLLP